MLATREGTVARRPLFTWILMPLACSPHWWAWDWASFWSQLAAGVITFSLGIPLALWLIRHELNLSRRRQFQDFRALATQVWEDFVEVERVLRVWADQVSKRKMISPVDPKDLTWEIDESHLRSVFASYGVQHTTQSAVTWYRAALEIARLWNQQLAVNALADDTARRAGLRIPGALSKVAQARERLEEVAELPS